MSSPTISQLIFGRYSSPFGIGESRPTIAFRYAQDPTTSQNWLQKGCEIKISRDGTTNVHQLECSSNIEIPWPEKEPELRTRDIARVEVRARGTGGKWTDWATDQVEVSLLQRDDWNGAKFIAPDISPPTRLPKRPFYARKAFTISKQQLESLRQADTPLRIYGTALGAYRLELNGKPIGDHVLAPGWQSYDHRLHVQTYSIPVTQLSEGENVLGVVVGEGWYSGRLIWVEGMRNCWGSEPGVMILLSLGSSIRSIKTEGDWEWTYGPILSSELYDGEQFDVDLIDPSWSKADKSSSMWRTVKTLPPLPDSVHLICPEAPPIRRVAEIKAVELITTPSGKKIINFGQNLVGWVKVKHLPPAKKPASDSRGLVNIKHFEWLELGEPNYAILRSAKATDKIFLGATDVYDWEPSFTTHGFQYIEIEGWEGEIETSNFTAVVVMSDMERLGDFTCSHQLVNKLHENVVWGLKGNFVGVPTDCPQRDERLGYTGDLQVFASTANYLYDTQGFLADWLDDLKVEARRNEDVPPIVAPEPVKKSPPERFAIWSDVIALGPWELYQAYGGTQILAEFYEAMYKWLEKGITRGKDGLWDDSPPNFQLGDWLDPRAPADNAALAMTDPYLVANAYLVGVTEKVAEIAEILHKKEDANRFREQHARLRAVWQNNYVTPSGRLVSDSQTAVVVALQWNLLNPDQIDTAVDRLSRLVLENKFRIGTGFAGTPVILPALAEHGRLQLAYRMLQEGKCPSWLYPVSVGATTVWERWDSLKPDGTVNTPLMTSFNHYALGAVAHFLHSVTGGISPAKPGYREILVKPQPGGSLTWAKTQTISPSGKISCDWEILGNKIKISVEIPPNTTAKIVLPGQSAAVAARVGSGFFEYEVDWVADKSWPPMQTLSSWVPADKTLLLE